MDRTLCDISNAGDLHVALASYGEDELEVIEVIIAVIQKRADRWQDQTTGLGDPDIDKFSHALGAARAALIILQSGAPNR